MNADILKGRWMELKGEVKTRWGKLTDDDLTEIEGMEEKLLGFLQKRYAEQELNDFIGPYDRPVSTARKRWRAEKDATRLG